MLGAAIAVTVIGFILRAIAAQPAGWFLVPLAALACIYHVRVHAYAAEGADPPRRVAAVSNVLMIGALILQMDYTPGYNCAWDTLSGVGYRLGWTHEMACTWSPGWPSIILDLLLYIPVLVTWRWLWTGAAPQRG